MNKVVCIDFDGTVVTHEYPEIGREIPGCLEVIRSMVALDVKVVLWTMRSGEELQAAVQWFAEREIPLFGVNRNPEQDEWTDSPKAYAQFYIDDAAIGCPLLEDTNFSSRPFVDWQSIGRQVGEKLQRWFQSVPGLEVV